MAINQCKESMAHFIGLMMMVTLPMQLAATSTLRMAKQ
jgi:hypothetical protein